MLICPSGVKVYLFNKCVSHFSWEIQTCYIKYAMVLLHIFNIVWKILTIFVSNYPKTLHIWNLKLKNNTVTDQYWYFSMISSSEITWIDQIIKYMYSTCLSTKRMSFLKLLNLEYLN